MLVFVAATAGYTVNASNEGDHIPAAELDDGGQGNIYCGSPCDKGGCGGYPDPGHPYPPTGQCCAGMGAYCPCCWNPHSHGPPHSHRPHSHSPHHAHSPVVPHAHTPVVPAAWPSFQSVADLSASPWGAYYTSVYGELPAAGAFPLAVGNNWVLFDTALITAKVSGLPASSTCPTGAGDRYTENDYYQPPSISWIWQPYPYPAVAADTYVEVFHEADPFGDEHIGMWLLYSPGSGVWFNVGKTISFAEHEDAYQHFAIPAGGDMNDAMSKAAAAAGFDSVQFLAHVDHVNYPCDTQNTGTPGFQYMGLEIVATKLVGTYACGQQAGGAPPTIRKGWGGSTACDCDNSKQFLNCQGVPLLSASRSSWRKATRTSLPGVHGRPAHASSV